MRLRGLLFWLVLLYPSLLDLCDYVFMNLSLFLQNQLLDMENKIQLSKDEIIMGFVASCIEDVADTLGVDYLEVYRRMDAIFREICMS